LEPRKIDIADRALGKPPLVLLSERVDALASLLVHGVFEVAELFHAATMRPGRCPVHQPAIKEPADRRRTLVNGATVLAEIDAGTVLLVLERMHDLAGDGMPDLVDQILAIIVALLGMQDQRVGIAAALAAVARHGALLAYAVRRHLLGVPILFRAR